MVPIRYPIAILFVLFLFIGCNLDDVSRSQRDLTPILLDPSTPISTITPIYEPSPEVFIDETTHIKLNNTMYTNYRGSFYIDDTQSISNNLDLVCNPSNFGYSIKQGEFIFPNHTYPNCSDINQKNYPEINLDYKHNLFTMKCTSGTPYYILESKDRKGRLFNYDEMTEILDKHEYKGPVKLTNEEFVFGSCNGKIFNNAINIPRFKPNLLAKTSEKMSDLNIKNKPLIVMLLTIDSYSRRHFFRKLPNTVKFLNNLNSSFAAFDFKLHNEFGGSSVENMVPIFSGIIYIDMEIIESEIPREYDALDDSM